MLPPCQGESGEGGPGRSAKISREMEGGTQQVQTDHSQAPCCQWHAPYQRYVPLQGGTQPEGGAQPEAAGWLTANLLGALADRAPDLRYAPPRRLRGTGGITGLKLAPVVKLNVVVRPRLRAWTHADA